MLLCPTKGWTLLIIVEFWLAASWWAGAINSYVLLHRGLLFLFYAFADGCFWGIDLKFVNWTTNWDLPIWLPDSLSRYHHASVRESRIGRAFLFLWRLKSRLLTSFANALTQLNAHGICCYGNIWHGSWWPTHFRHTGIASRLSKHIFTATRGC